MLEIKFCSKCGQVVLAGTRSSDKLGREWQIAPPREDGEDEFFSDLEPPEPSTDDEQGDPEAGAEPAQSFEFASDQVLVAPLNAGHGTVQNIDCAPGQIRDKPEPTSRQYRLGDPRCCPYCEATFSSRAERLLSIRMSGPFLLGSIVPELLDDGPEAALPIHEGKPDSRRRPADSRQLLMFTDSRQGTARLSAKPQRDAEQNHVRAFIYHKVQSSRVADDAEKRRELEQIVTSLREPAKLNPALQVPVSIPRQSRGL